MTCAHCSVESSSRIRNQPSEEMLEGVVTQAAAAGVRAMLFTGGEPMLREELVTRLVRLATRSGLGTAITTNGFWGKSASSALSTLKRLRKAGLSFFTLSYDRYHAEFQGPQPGLNIMKAAESLKVSMNLNVTRVADDKEMGALLEPFASSSYPKLRVYDVQPVGRARELDKKTLRQGTHGRCQAAEVPSVTDDGRLIACNGPSYFQPAHSPLNVGSLNETPLADLLARHRDDPILQTVRTFGPERLRSELSQIPGFENFEWRESYSGLCDLCLHINSDAAAASALRDRLSSPELVAERAARKLVIDGVRIRGDTGREYVVGPAAAKMWIRGARDARVRSTQKWIEDSGRIFGRADADWLHMASYISACGLSNPLLAVVRDPSISRWAPAMFLESVERDAMIQARRELVQRRVLDIIAEELRDMGVRGVLLKGAAMVFRELKDPVRFGSRPGIIPRRSALDIDVVVPVDAARDLRTRLIRRGAQGNPDAQRTGPHHLAPVVVLGVPVEIHTRIMPSWWALPETELLSHLWQPDDSPLATLDAEGMMVHTLMHSASHLFGCGLKAAWDVAWALDRHETIDYDRVVEWSGRCAMTAGFWLPARILKDALDLPLPERLFEHVDSGVRYDVLQRVLRQRMFIAMEGTSDLNPFSKHALLMLLHSTWRGRMLHVYSLFKPEEREARRANPANGTIATQLRDTYEQYRTYRRLCVRARTDASLQRRSKIVFSETGLCDRDVSAP